jgi:hypothetical protein
MSTSLAKTEVRNIDKRAAAGNDSVLISSDTSTVNVEVLDGGAIDLAKTAVSSNNLATKDVLDFAKVIMGGAYGVAGQSAALAEGSVAQVKDAYQARDVGVIDKNTLMLAGIAAAAFIAVKVMRAR